MTLHEAIKTGKRFKRANKKVWYRVEDDVVFDDAEHRILSFSVVSLFADDWEVEEEKIELSWEHVKNAISLYSDYGHSLSEVKKELGF